MRPDGGGDDGGGGGRDARLFTGVQFALYGFDAAAESQIRKEILQRGGEEVRGHRAESEQQIPVETLLSGGEEHTKGNGATPTPTYLIVNRSILFDDLKCVEARQRGVKVISALWVDFSLDNNRIEDPDRILYRPAKQLNPVPGFNGLNICCIGYGTRNMKYIMKLVELAGAKPSDYTDMCEADLLICSSFEGRDYELSVKMGIDAVTHQWLKDCILQWKYLPIDKYTKKGQELLMETPTKAPICTSHLQMLNSDSKDSMLRESMSPALLKSLKGQELLMETPTKAPISTSHLRMLNSDSKDSMLRESMSPALLKRQSLSTGSKKGQELLMETPTKAPISTSNLRMLNSDSKDSMVRASMSPAMLKRQSLSTGSKRSRSSVYNNDSEFVCDGQSTNRIDHPKCRKTLDLDVSKNSSFEAKIGSSISNSEVLGSCSKATAEDRPSKCPDSMEVTASATQSVTLQSYKSNNRLIKFSEVPESNVLIRRSKDEVKQIYIDSFSKLANIHKKNGSLGGQFGPENFMVSLADHSVTMVDLAPLVKYSVTAGNMDYETFVRMVRSFYEGETIPQDVSNWLELISKGVQSSSPVLLSNHMLMMQDEAAYGIFTSMYHCMLEFKKERNLEFKRMLESEHIRKYNIWKSWNICRILRGTFSWEHPVTRRKAQYENNIMGVLQLLRNCGEHKAKACAKEFLSIVLSLDVDLLPVVQKILMEAGYLKHLRL